MPKKEKTLKEIISGVKMRKKMEGQGESPKKIMQIFGPDAYSGDEVELLKDRMNTGFKQMGWKKKESGGSGEEFRKKAIEKIRKEVEAEDKKKKKRY